jgi:hypothetical protein
MIKAKTLSEIGSGSRVTTRLSQSRANSLPRAGLALPLASGWVSWVRGLTGLGQLGRVWLG